MKTATSNEDAYRKLLVKIKTEVHAGQMKAALAVNSALIQLYWDLGKLIADNKNYSRAGIIMLISLQRIFTKLSLK